MPALFWGSAALCTELALPEYGVLTSIARSDGDTLHMDTNTGPESIRLSDIDAPETSHGKGRPGQPYSQAARKLLLQLAGSQRLELKCFERDRNGRAVCFVFAGRVNLSMEMLAAGLAWPAERKRYIRSSATYSLAAEARAGRKGLWSEPGAIPPWDWRRECWAAKRCELSGQVDVD